MLKRLPAVAALLLWVGSAEAHPSLDHDIEAATRRISRSPTPAREVLTRGEFHRLAGRFDAAERDYAGAARLDPRLDEVALCRAAVLFDRGRLAEADAVLEGFHSAHPERTDALILGARIAARRGRPLEAARDLSVAIERLPAPGPDLYLERAGLLTAAGQEHAEEALEGLERGIARLGPVVSLELAVVDLLAARARYDDALARLDGVLAGLERPGPLLARRAEILSLGGDEQAARWTRAVLLAQGKGRDFTAAAPEARPARSLLEKSASSAEAASIGSDNLSAPGRPERLALAAPPAPGAVERASLTTLTRGPYLTSGTPNGATIRWRTAELTNSQVRWGTSPGNLALANWNLTLTTEHEITLAGCVPNTRYYYSIGTTTEVLAGGDAQHTFVTAPPPGTPKPTRLWIIGDSGTADANAAAVRNAFATYSASRPADLWLMLGDNAYGSGTDAEYQAAVFNMYPAMLRSSVLWPTRGNHDVIHSGANNDYYDIFTLPIAGEAGGLASGTEAYYSFDYGDIHFVCLDSEGSNRTVGGAMAMWLRADLAATSRHWVIAFWHHPPYSKGSHDSDDVGDSGGRMQDMRQNMLPILDSAGVDVVLTGHSHSYERSFLLSGHYGLSTTLTGSMIVDGGDGRWNGDGGYLKPTWGKGPREGSVYAVAGSSGSAGGGSLNHPVMVTSLNQLGSMVVDISGNRLDARYLDNLGAIRDSFTIVKGAVADVGEPPEPGAEGIQGVSPNPARGPIEIRYHLTRPLESRLVIVDVLGRRVRMIRSGPAPAGRQHDTWDGRDDRGRQSPAGVYFAVLEAGGRQWARRVVRLDD